jgi:acyl-CoA synthetase (AMP-forming)/AMP-acid ligase II
MLWGVSFALLDLAEKGKIDLSGALIIETGGMKGQREELIRADLHARLKNAFGCSEIHSEYGMAELTSQAYMMTGRFNTPPWMKVVIRDINDPFDKMPVGRVGGLNVIDLANVHSCAFIETQDLGEVDEQGTFQVLGRIDNSDVRGCNLMIDE